MKTYLRTSFWDVPLFK